MPLFKTKAFVLKSTPFKDYDKRVVLLTEDHGKIVGIARGAKKSQRRFGGGLESLTLVTAIYFEKHQQGLVRLQEVQVIDHYEKVKSSVQRLAYGSYFLELISEVMREREASKNLFSYLKAYLEALEKTKNEALLSRLFEARLLPKIGWRPILDQCVVCKKETTALRDDLLFSMSLGGIICRECFSSEKRKGFLESKKISKEAALYLEAMIAQKTRLKMEFQLGKELQNILPPLFISSTRQKSQIVRFYSAGV